MGIGAQRLNPSYTPERSEGSAFMFDPATQRKSRFFVAEFTLSMAEGLLRMTLRKVSRATDPRTRAAEPPAPIFKGGEEHEV
jgi:hypothetical protein